MFTLREMTADGQEYNRYLGLEYSQVLEKNTPDVFKRGIENSSEDPEFYLERSFGWISFNKGKDIVYLTKGKEYYIVSADGQTQKKLKE